MTQQNKPIRVALLGCGVVGTAVARLLDEQAAELAARVGAPLELAGIAVRRPNRHPDVDQALLTTDAESLVRAEDIDIVVRDCWLPGDVQPGDLVAVAATGAYCYAMASNYNRIPRPPVVAVTDGTARLIVRRESLDEVMATDVGWSAGTDGAA